MSSLTTKEVENHDQNSCREGRELGKIVETVEPENTGEIPQLAWYKSLLSSAIKIQRKSSLVHKNISIYMLFWSRPVVQLVQHSFLPEANHFFQRSNITYCSVLALLFRGLLLLKIEENFTLL